MRPRAMGRPSGYWSRSIERALSVTFLLSISTGRLQGSRGRLDDVKAALERNGLRAVAITPEIYNRDYVKGSITNPDPAVRSQALKLLERGH